MALGEAACETKASAALQHVTPSTSKDNLLLTSTPGGSRGSSREPFVLYKRRPDEDAADLSEDDSSFGSSTDAELRSLRRYGEGGAQIRGVDGGRSGDPAGEKGLVDTVASFLGTAVRHIAGDEFTDEILSPISSSTNNDEALYEDSINRQFM